MTGVTTAPTTATPLGALAAPGRRPINVRQFVGRHPTMVAGLAIVAVMVVVALAAPLLTGYDPAKLSPPERLRPPSAQHFFGTDVPGRDVFARTLYGSRVSLTIGLSVALGAATFGALAGMIAGAFRQFDTPLMRVMDGMMAFPGLLLALALVAFFGGSMLSVIGVLTVVETPRIARTVRSAVLSLREQPFVEAARCVGVGDARLIRLHILPNVVAPLIVQGTFIFAGAILAEASLSFLGVGTPPTIPSWGNIIGEGRTYIRQAPWLSLFPGLSIMLTVLAINLIGDGLRDLLDPKISRRA